MEWTTFRPRSTIAWSRPVEAARKSLIPVQTHSNVSLFTINLLYYYNSTTLRSSHTYRLRLSVWRLSRRKYHRRSRHTHRGNAQEDELRRRHRWQRGWRHLLLRNKIQLRRPWKRWICARHGNQSEHSDARSARRPRKDAVSAPLHVEGGRCRPLHHKSEPHRVSPGAAREEARD